MLDSGEESQSRRNVFSMETVRKANSSISFAQRTFIIQPILGNFMASVSWVMHWLRSQQTLPRSIGSAELQGRLVFLFFVSSIGNSGDRDDDLLLQIKKHYPDDC